MSKRENGLEDYSFKPWREPEMTVNRSVEVIRAADLHRTANPSDPFARDRAMLYMKRGLALPSEITSDAKSQLEARERARAS